MDTVESDLLILGAGRAGLCAALHAADLKIAVSSALARRMLTNIVAKVEVVRPVCYHMDPTVRENRFQFWRHLQSRSPG